MTRDGADCGGDVVALFGGYGNGHGENSVGVAADIQVENGDNDCELVFYGDSDDTLMEPPGKKLRKADSWTRCWAWAAKALVDC